MKVAADGPWICHIAGSLCTEVCGRGIKIISQVLQMEGIQGVYVGIFGVYMLCFTQ